jgi:hypothetical protein
MYLAYYDESGDDGFPAYSSPLFVLSACYFHYMHWQDLFRTIQDMRIAFSSKYGIPAKTELHWKYFLLNKRPYAELKLTDAARLSLLTGYCEIIAQLNLKVINVGIVKARIQRKDYQVLDTAFKYSIQRVENDLNPIQNPGNKFLIITDPGRVGKMRKISRRIQRVNFIPSKFSAGSFNREIKALIEDPLPKESQESHFIQLCDLIAYLVYLYMVEKTACGQFPKRLLPKLTIGMVRNLLDVLKPILNLQASGSDPYGIVIHPK